MSLKSDAGVAHELHQGLSKLVLLQGRTDIRVAETLWNLKKNNLYKKAIGEGINTWVDYLRQPEVNITQHRARKLLRVYEHFIHTLGYTSEQLEGVPLYAMDYIAQRTLSDIDQVDTLLADAVCLSDKDFKERYHDEVNSSEPRTYTYLVMQKCKETGSMSKVHNISSEQIQTAFNL